MTAARQAAERRGRRAEGMAALWLRLAGWRIVARDLRTPVGEIDIVARRGRVLALVEVKHRATEADALAAVTPRQRARIARAAGWLLAARPELAGLDVRFDVMVPRRFGPPRHLVGAWQVEQGWAP